MNQLNVATLIEQALPANRRSASKGWTSFDAPCCTHRGETPDRRSRGGMLFTDTGGVRYHCFNCGYITGWEPGSPFPLKMRRLMQWFGVGEDRIKQMVFVALRDLNQEVVEQQQKQQAISFEPVQLPNCASVAELAAAGAESQDENFAAVVEYIKSRGFELDDYDWRWSPQSEKFLNKRVIIPYTWQGKEIGYTARSISDTSKMKYIQHVDSDYVFNIDAIKREHEFVIVTEGVFDAIAVGGVAVLTNTISDMRAEIIESTGKRPIAIPDQDAAGLQFMESALELGWSVSFPAWQPGIKDAASAKKEYGSLYTVKSILSSTVDSALKARLLGRKVFK